jgi:GGDEF domain-containing protein
MVNGDQLVGVLTLYSEQANAFNDNHRRVIETVAAHIAPAFATSEADTGNERDPITGLVRLERHEPLQKHLPADKLARASVFLVSIRDLSRIHNEMGRDLADDVVRLVVKHIKAQGQDQGTLLRCGSDQLVLVLSPQEAGALATLSGRIRDAVRNDGITLSDRHVLKIDVDVVCLALPPTDSSINDLFAAATQGPANYSPRIQIH